MKFKLLLLLLVYLIACNNPFIGKNAQIDFIAHEKDLGVLNSRETVKCSFEFHNSGKYPLKIKDVRTSCGCNVTSWTKNPLDPGEHGKITIEFNNLKKGILVQYIQVYYNSDASPVVLIIKGNVENS